MTVEAVDKFRGKVCVGKLKNMFISLLSFFLDFCLDEIGLKNNVYFFCQLL